MKKTNFTFHEDPGHGWLEVPEKLLMDLDIANKVSGFSYVNNDKVYLEEDGDLSLFMGAMKDAGRETDPHDWKSKYYDRDAPLRFYRRYPGYVHPLVAFR